MEAQERFVFQLRPQEVFDAVRNGDLPEIPEQREIESALAQLCEWGNLQTQTDTTNVSAVEDFYKQRHTFEITHGGEAAERACTLFCTTSGQQVEPQYTGLLDIRQLLQDLKQLAQEVEPDAGKIHRHLLLLRDRFEDLTATAQAFVSLLERNIHEQAVEARQLIDYGERLIGELVLAGDHIGVTVRDIEAAGLDRLLQAVAERTVRCSLDGTPQQGIAAVCNEWRSHWERFCNWFIPQPGRPSNAEKLREYVRASMPALLRVAASINDRRIHRIDRSTDFRVLARWFAEAESDADAHRLWRLVFGLCPARHLMINDETLDEYDAENVAPSTNWLDAPPLQISMRLREYSRNLQTGSLSRVIDRSEEKQKLAAATHEQALHILKAQRRFGTNRRMRLSELEQMEAGEFDMFLDLLGEALSVRVLPTEAVEILSGDGSLTVRLEPTDDGRQASIITAEGIFSGPDHWISVTEGVNGLIRPCRSGL
jgi:uncharacterized protein (TIGR02677 family)